MFASLLLRPWPFVRLPENTLSQRRAQADAMQVIQSYERATARDSWTKETFRACFALLFFCL